MNPIHRFEDQIEALLQYPVREGKLLLYGSSFFHQWGYERANAQWAEQGELEIVNHGFGGATVEELLYYYHRLVLPYKPSAMVFRTGHNDVWCNTAEESFYMTCRLLNWVKNDFPGIPLVLIKAFDHPSALPENLHRLHKYNEMLDALAKENPQIKTLDLNPFFYGADGHFRDVFREDGLHLTDSGYAEMAAYLVPKVKALL